MNSANSAIKVIESGNNSTDSSQGKKQVNPSKKWCFTMNNYSEDNYSAIVCYIKRDCNVAIIAKEVGESGTPHLQGYLEFKVKKRPQSVFREQIDIDKFGYGGLSCNKPMKIHWSKAKGSKIANFEYCSKDDSNPWVWGFKLPKKVVCNIELYDWQKDIVTIIKGPPCERSIYWYWSYKGGIGKTMFSKWLTINYGAICLNGKGADVRNGILAYKESSGDFPDLVVYPIPRCHGSEYCSYEALENVKDMYFYSGKYEGGMVCGNPPHLIVFANAPPIESKLSADRWVVVCIDPENAPKEICEIDSLDC